MTTALQNGVSGLLAQQISMDTLGNNVANANTTAFKSSRAEFTDMLYQTIRPASATTPQRGGSNPSMLGAGVKVASLATNFSQGSLQDDRAQPRRRDRGQRLPARHRRSLRSS